MNPAPLAMTLEPQPKSRRRSTCHRHPAELVTGFCALCLSERLSGLDSPATSAAASSSIVPSTSGGRGGANPTGGRSRTAGADASSSLQPELRRCKSYVSSKCGASSGVSEPLRKSCDVRVRNSLWHLFSLDDEENGQNIRTKVESKNLGFSGVTGSVIESRGEVEDGGNIRVSEAALGQNVNDRIDEVEEETKTMKEHIELEWHSRKHTGRDLKEFAGSFWLAASVFSQKLRRLRLNQRMKNRRGSHQSRSALGGGVGDLLPAVATNVRKFRETQSEVGDYGYGRRSCDTDPRFSVDACQISLDDPRFSFDEPRASWDGYMIARTIPRLAPMLSVIENAMMPHANRSECGKIEEQMNSINENGTTSGRDYCSDSSSSQMQNSFDCSSSSKSSNKKAMGLEVDEMKSMSNPMVSPTTIVVTDRGTGDSDFNSLKFNHLGSFESACKDAKKLGKWRKPWKILWFMHKPNETKNGKVGGNGIGNMMGDCREKQNGEFNGKVVNGASSATLLRSSSCVSSRSSHKTIGSYSRSLSVAETRDYAKKSREESVLERNRSAKYSPSNFENGLLRFHLTPSWSCRRKSGRSKLKNLHLQLN